MANVQTLESRTRRRIILLIVVLVLFFNHFIKHLVSTSGVMQAAGVENYAMKDGTIRNLNEFRLATGKKIRGGAKYCPERATEGCELVLDGLNVILGLSG